jgi:hydrogenase/urease accessory protein HupE
MAENVARHGKLTPFCAVKLFGSFFCAGLLLATTARAHVVGISMAQGRMFGDTLELVVGFAPADAQQLLPPEERPQGPWSQATFDAVKPQLLWLASQLWEVTAGDTKLKPAEIRVELLPGDNVSFRLLFIRPPGADQLTLHATRLASLPPGHREFVIIGGANGVAVAKKLLNAQDDTMTIDLSPATAANQATTSGSTTTFWDFLKLGIEHIWTGYDHLLFLFALLVVCRSFRSIAIIITCFTLAHSTTLALATLNIVSLPSRITEPAIAASILFVGVENLLRRGAEPRGRWALTFAFGLVHGFGFASVLRDLGVGENGTSIVLPLFTFNAGVEVGQISIAALVLPIVWRLRKKEIFLRRGVPALSAIVSAAGLYWFLERTVFA